MNLRFLRGASCAIVFAAGLILPSSSLAQRPPGGGPPAGGRPTPGQNSDIFPTASLHVYVRGPDGSPIDQMALVTLFTWTNQMYRQSTTQGGNAEFDSIPPGQYTIQVIAPAYENAKENVERSEEHTSELQSLAYLVCRLLLEKKKTISAIQHGQSGHHRHRLSQCQLR